MPCRGIVYNRRKSKPNQYTKALINDRSKLQILENIGAEKLR